MGLENVQKGGSVAQKFPTTFKNGCDPTPPEHCFLSFDSPTYHLKLEQENNEFGWYLWQGDKIKELNWIEFSIVMICISIVVNCNRVYCWAWRFTFYYAEIAIYRIYSGFPKYMRQDNRPPLINESKLHPEAFYVWGRIMHFIYPN